eukprot:295499_1
MRYMSKSLFTISHRYNTKIIIPLRCHIPLDKIPKQLQKKLNKAEKYINSLGVSIKKIQLPPLNTMDTSPTIPTDTKDDTGSQTKLKEPILDESNALIVGSIHQYPQITHYNQAKILQIFGKNRLNKNSWSFDSKIQENYNISLSTAIDYYPFPNTFPPENNQNTKKKSKTFNQLNNKWKIRRKGYNIRCRDSFNDKLPLLSREYNSNGDEQELVIYRDVPYDLNSLISVLPIIREYSPDIIVFEYGRLPFFDKYIERKMSFSNIILPIKKIFALVIPFKTLQFGLGKLFYNISKKYYKTEISSYGFEGSLDFVSRFNYKKKNVKKIPMIAGDLHHKITDTLRVFNDYLDLYNIATLIHYDIIDDRFIKASTRVKLGDNLGNIIQMRLYPHMMSMNVYRNDMLSCVINELSGEKYKKVLLISQAMRLKDLYDKLCGKSGISKWIKTMDNEHILMSKLNLYQYDIGMTNKENTYLQNMIKSEYDEDIMKCIGYLGYEQTAFLLLKYPLENTLNERKKDKIIDMTSDNLNEYEFIDKLKDLYDK